MTDNKSITTKFTWFPTQYKNSNGSYLGSLWINTIGKLMPNGFDEVDFELTNLVKQIRNLVSDKPDANTENLTPKIITETKAADIATYNKIGGAKKSPKKKARKTRKHKK